MFPGRYQYSNQYVRNYCCFHGDVPPEQIISAGDTPMLMMTMACFWWFHNNVSQVE
jgi:hypothetical protein